MKINRPEIFFVIIILVFGTLLTFITPLGAGADEETHVARIWEMSKGVLIPNQYLSTGPYFPFVFYQLSYRQDINLNPVSWETWKTQLFTKIDWNVMINYTIRARYSPTFYLPQAFIMGIMGRVLDIPVGFIYYVERLSYLMIYALTVYWAIRLLPVGKWVFGILAVTPMSLIQASTITADSFNNGIAFVFIAWVLYLNSPAKKTSFSRRDWIITAFLVLCVCTLKLNALPLLLILFLVPRVKFGTKKGLAAFVIFTLLSILVVCVGWNYFTSSQLLYSATDQGYKVVDQLNGVLADPLHFISAVVTDIWTQSPTYFHNWMGVSGYGYWDLPALVYWITPILILLAILSEGVGDFLTRGKRIVMGATFLAVFLGTVVLFYLLYNPPGTNLIPGIQGRYFLFIGPVVMIAVLPQKALLHLKNIWLQAGSIFVAGLCVGALFLGYHVTCGESYFSTGLCYLPRYKNWSPDTSLPLKVAPTQTGSQTFSADCNDLTDVRLWIRNKGSSAAPASVKIRYDGSQETVLSRLITSQEIPSSGWFDIRFPALPDSRNKKFVIEVAPADSGGQPDIELAYSAVNEYLAGDLKINNEKQAGDLLFEYGCSVGLGKLFGNP